MSSSAQYFLIRPSGGPGGSRLVLLRTRRWIDAATRDYVVEGGQLKQDDGFTSKVVLALGTKLGSCQVLPSFGSRLHEIKYADERGRKLAEAYARLALVHLTEEIQDLTITATLPGAGRIDLVIEGRKGTRGFRANYSHRLGG